MTDQPDAAERYRTRFGGYSLDALNDLVDTGLARYDDRRHVWLIASPGSSTRTTEVRDVDWHAAMKAAALPPEHRPLRWARAISPVAAVGLDDSLSLVLQVPEGTSRVTISDGDALKAAIDEARQVRAQIQARYDTSRHSLPRRTTDDQPRT